MAEDERYQKELFEIEKPKRRFFRLDNILPKADFEGRISITLSLENIIFISIGILMMLVVVYALGVENGKSKGLQPTVMLQNNPDSPKSSVSGKTKQAKVVPLERALITTAPEVRKKDIVKTEALPGAFTILAATYTNRDSAVREVNRLKAAGFLPFIVRSNGYFRVCAGSYKDKNGSDAARDLKKLKRIHKDAYIIKTK